MAFLTRAKRTQDKETAVKHAGLRREIAANEAAAKKATSPLEIAKQTVLGIPRATVDVAKDFAKGAVEFGISAGEAPVRLASPKHSAAILPATEVPGLKFLGPVQSFQSKAAQKVVDGKTPLRASLEGVGDTVINDPAGIAFKPLVVAGGFLARTAMKNRGTNPAKIISDIIQRGKGAVVEDAARAPGPAIRPTPVARRDAEFEGMDLPARLDATAERKLPVFGDTSLRRIPVDGQSRTAPVPIANDYRQTQPDIQVGRTPRGAPEPVAGRSPAAGGAPPGYTYEPVPGAAPGPLASVAAPSRAPRTAVAEAPRTVEQPVSRETAPGIPEQANSRAIPAQNAQISPEISAPEAPAPRSAPAGETKASGLARGVEAQAIEKKLTDGFEGLSEYETINIKDQAERAETIIRTDPEKARRIAMGLEEAPNGTKNFAVYTAVEQKAIKDGDVATLRDLATRSRLNAESSESAQTLRLLAERDPESPVAAIADIAATRAKVAERRGTKAAATVKAETAKAKAAIAKAPKEDWNSFVDSITC